MFNIENINIGVGKGVKKGHKIVNIVFEQPLKYLRYFIVLIFYHFLVPEG